MVPLQISGEPEASCFVSLIDSFGPVVWPSAGLSRSWTTTLVARIAPALRR